MDTPGCSFVLILTTVGQPEDAQRLAHALRRLAAAEGGDLLHQAAATLRSHLDLVQACRQGLGPGRRTQAQRKSPHDVRLHSQACEV